MNKVKQKQKRAAQALERSRRNTQPKHKSPSKLRRLERRAAERTAGVVAGVVKERRSFFKPVPDVRDLSRNKKAALAVKKLQQVRDSKLDVLLETLTKAELMDLAKKRNIKGRSKMDKAQLVEALS